MRKHIMIGSTPEDVRDRLKSVKIALQKRFARNVPYWEVLQYLLALYEEKHSEPKKIFPHNI